MLIPDALAIERQFVYAQRGRVEPRKLLVRDVAPELGPILDEIEARLAEYIAPGGDGRSTRLFVSQLTREHPRLATHVLDDHGKQRRHVQTNIDAFFRKHLKPDTVQ